MKDDSKYDCGDHIQIVQHIVDECCNLRSAKGTKSIDEVLTDAITNGQEIWTHRFGLCLRLIN